MTPLSLQRDAQHSIMLINDAVAVIDMNVERAKASGFTNYELMAVSQTMTEVAESLMKTVAIYHTLATSPHFVLQEKIMINMYQDDIQHIINEYRAGKMTIGHFKDQLKRRL